MIILTDGDFNVGEPGEELFEVMLVSRLSFHMWGLSSRVKNAPSAVDEVDSL